MGLFGSKKVTVVSSVVYNLLGDDEPTNYVATSILDAVINPKSDMSLSENLFNKITSGPAANFRKYIQWSKNSDYQKHLGLATSSYYNVDFLSDSEAEKLIKKYLNLDDSVILVVTKAEFARYNMYLFADAWVVNNKPDQKDTEYIVEDVPVRKHPDSSIIWNNPIVRYDIVITFTDGSSVTIDTSSFDTNARYLYIQYYVSNSNNTKTYGYLIYKEGDGFEEFDVLFSEPQALSNTYSAFLPFRAWNTFLSDEEGKEYLPEVYKLAKRGANLAIGDNKYTDLMDAIADNESISEIDFAYLHFGVPLNIPYDYGKEYIFEYFNNLADYNTEFGKKINIPLDDLAVTNEEGTVDYYVDYYGTEFDGIDNIEVTVPGTVYIRSPGTNLNFNITINWDNITKSIKQGLCKEDAVPGKYYVWNQKDAIKLGEGYIWVREEESDRYHKESVGDVFTSAEVLHITFQETSNRYTEIQVWSAEQLNYIYGGKYTATYSDDAFAEKDLSDFIVPIQYNSFLETNMAKMNNTMQCCYNLIFNCYTVYKKKWYQTGIFTVIVVIVVIIITIVSYGSASSASAAMVGTVGGATAASLGLTAGTLAYLVVAAAVNTIAAIVLAKVVTLAATKIFGEKLGIIIGTILSIVISYGSSFANSEFSFSISNITDKIASNPGLFTASVAMQGGNIYVQLLGLKIKSVLQNINDLYLAYQDKMEEVQEKTDELLGYNQYSPLFLSSVLDPEEPLVYEDRDTFLSRTLMVGSDIVDLTLNSITNFTKLNLNLELT